MILFSLPQAPPPTPTVFVGVDVIPMDRESVLADQTVVVRDGKIVALGPEKDVAVPPHAVLVPARGRFLMPALADMHVHIWSEDDFPLLFANGVTTVRNMFGAPLQLEWRKKIDAGELVGPTIYTAGPIIDGDPPIWPGSTVLTDPAKAEGVVVEQKEAGYDFLKVYAKLPLDAYDALMVAAKRHGMRVMGHVPEAVGLAHVIASGQESVEHLDGWAAAAQADDSPFLGKVSFVNQPQAWQHFDAKKIEQLAKSVAAAGVWDCPTLVVYQKWAVGDEAEKSFARPEMKYVSPMVRTFWKPENNYLQKMPPDFVAEAHASDADRKRALGILHKAGARVLLGTDLGNPFVVAGFSLHEELLNLVAAGLSPYEALRAGTSGAAEFMHAGAEWGTVAVGRRADLVLLDKNPLENVANAKLILGVMVRGWWLSKSEIRRSLDELALKYAGSGERPK
jgi:imidazolonepropionase-like amidohydrolase